MTITDVTSTVATTIDRPRYRPVSFDLYRDIHKAIRVEMFEVVANAGRIDPGDRAACDDLADQVDALVTFLHQHAEHEDGTLQAPLEQVAPHLAGQVATEHTAIEARLDHVVALAQLLRRAPERDRRAVAHELYLDLAAFTGDYLAHQDLEERVIGQALDAALGTEGLLALNGAILASIPPHELSASLALMFPAMNVDDRVDLLGGMRATAPAEVFDANWSLARSVLTAREVDELSARLGLA
ncbi:MAG: hemerythrin domain-containing protein [Ilumatobacteraceae bacterium]|jgi:hypothetical protein|nr:hemerythrin domain-containing protein [Ilumatobacteraceae bacterium]